MQTPRFEWVRPGFEEKSESVRLSILKAAEGRALFASHPFDDFAHEGPTPNPQL